MTRKIKILIIEDSAIIRQDVVHAIMGGGILLMSRLEFFEAADGQKGIEAFKEKDPDLVLTDITLPRMNGVEVVRYIRKSGSDVPIVVMVPEGMENHGEEAMAEGATFCITKPLHAGVLEARLPELVRILEDNPLPAPPVLPAKNGDAVMTHDSASLTFRRSESDHENGDDGISFSGLEGGQDFKESTEGSNVTKSRALRLRIKRAGPGEEEELKEKRIEALRAVEQKQASAAIHTESHQGAKKCRYLLFVEARKAFAELDGAPVPRLEWKECAPHDVTALASAVHVSFEGAAIRGILRCRFAEEFLSDETLSTVFEKIRLGLAKRGADVEWGPEEHANALLETGNEAERTQLYFFEPQQPLARIVFEFEVHPI